MTDIVIRLRNSCSCNFPDTPCGAEDECRAAFDAADEIERLRAALREISDLTITSTVADIYGDAQKEWLEQFDYAQSIARAALEGRT